MGKIVIHPNMTMGEILELYPGAQRALFQSLHLSGASNSDFTPNDTLQNVCQNHTLEVGAVIAHIYKTYEVDQESQISPREVAERLRRGEKFKLLDVRDAWEHDIARIEGAILVSDESVVKEITSWPKDTPIVIHCHHGYRSLDATAYLKDQGFTNVKSMAGGIDAWSHEVDPKIPVY